TGQMIVSNATLVFPDTSVGRHAGSVGIFTIQSDAVVLVTDDLSIGRFGDPVNSARGNLPIRMTLVELVATVSWLLTSVTNPVEPELSAMESSEEIFTVAFEMSIWPLPRLPTRIKPLV